MDDFWHLHNFDWLRELSPPESDELRRQATQRTYHPGEMVFTPLGRPLHVYLLERGLVRIYRVSNAGAEATLGYVRPGEIFGEVAALSSAPRESFAAAVRTSEVWRLSRDVIRRVLAAHSSIVLAITKQVGSRLKRIESRVEHLVFRPVRSRVAGMLLELAEDFGRRDAHGIVIDLELNQQDLATLVGASRQAVNGSLRELERAKAIRRSDGRVVLLALDVLRASKEEHHGA